MEPLAKALGLGLALAALSYLVTRGHDAWAIVPAVVSAALALGLAFPGEITTPDAEPEIKPEIKPDRKPGKGHHGPPGDA